MRSLWDFALSLLMLVGFAAIIMAIVVLPQSALGLLVSRGGGPMLLPAIAFVALGYIQATRPVPIGPLIAIAVSIFWMANARGFYWEMFPDGDGFLTANRVSSWGIFGCCFYGPIFWADRRAAKADRG